VKKNPADSVCEFGIINISFQKVNAFVIAVEESADIIQNINEDVLIVVLDRLQEYLFKVVAANRVYCRNSFVNQVLKDAS
jgi:hypothetical protein